MVLIEGIGDEVIVTLGLGLAFLAVILAWWSTHVPDVRWPRVIQWQVIVARELGLQGTSVEQYTVTSRDDETALPASAALQQDGASSTEQVAASSSPAAVVETTAVSRVASEEPAAAAPAATSETDEASAVNSSSEVQLEASDSNTTDQTEAITPEGCSFGVEGTDARCAVEPNELRRRRCNFFSGQMTADGTTNGSPAVEPIAESMCAVQQQSAVSTASQPTVNPAAELSGTTASDDGNQIRIRLRYLTEDERLVLAHPSTTVISFKRQNFSDDLAANKLVRFIFNGQVLQDDRTLESYNILDNTVVHTLITLASEGAQQSAHGGMRQSAGGGGGAAAASGESHDMFDAGSLMVPLFALILAVIWYLRFAYRQFFNVTSTLSLGGITILFGICLYANHRHQRLQPAATTSS